MNDWQKKDSAEGAALGVVRAIISWFSGLDAMAVVFGTCLLTCAGAFLALQIRAPAPVRPEPGQSFFGQLDSAEPVTPAMQARASSAPSSLEFAPRMPPQPETLPEASAEPDPQPPMPQPAAQPALPHLPAVAAAPKSAAALAQMKAAPPGGGGSGGVASGARIGAPAAAPEGKPAAGPKAGAIGGERSAARPPDEDRPDLVRQMIPLVQAYLGSGVASGYNSGGQKRAYAVEQFGKTVQERNLYISTSTIVTTKSAQDLAEGLGVIFPKAQLGNR